jgi:hypothetical protein
MTSFTNPEGVWFYILSIYEIKNKIKNKKHKQYILYIIRKQTVRPAGSLRGARGASPAVCEEAHNILATNCRYFLVVSSFMM